MDAVGVAGAFRKRREHNHSDWPVAGCGLIPGNKDGPARFVGRRIQDGRDILRKPGIALLDRVARGLAAIMHVIAQVRRDEVVSGHVIVGQVGGKFGEWPNMVDALRRVRVQRIRNVIEINKRIVLDRVFSAAGERTRSAGNIFLVGLP